MKHRKMKKLLALVLALCLLAGAMPLSASAAEYSGTCGANLKWEISGGTLTISGTGEMNDVALGADAPWEPFADSFTKIVVESGVTTIGDYTFTDLAGVTEVTLPDTLTSIGLYAFGGCESLQGITIPSCESIAHGAFRGCENLAYALLPENLTYIGQYAFSYTRPHADHPALWADYPADVRLHAVGADQCQPSQRRGDGNSGVRARPLGECGDRLRRGGHPHEHLHLLR